MSKSLRLSGPLEYPNYSKSMTIRNRLSKSFPDLSKRELDVAVEVAKGKTNREIATTYGLQEQSIKNLASSIMRKLKVENRVKIALIARGISPESDG